MVAGVELVAKASMHHGGGAETASRAPWLWPKAVVPRNNRKSVLKVGQV